MPVPLSITQFQNGIGQVIRCMLIESSLSDNMPTVMIAITILRVKYSTFHAQNQKLGPNYVTRDMWGVGATEERY